MTILEMLHDDDECIRVFGNACLQNAIEEQIQKNKGKTINEIEAQEMIDDIMKNIPNLLTENYILLNYGKNLKARDMFGKIGLENVIPQKNSKKIKDGLKILSIMP